MFYLHVQQPSATFQEVHIHVEVPERLPDPLGIHFLNYKKERNISINKTNYE